MKPAPPGISLEDPEPTPPILRVLLVEDDPDQAAVIAVPLRVAPDVRFALERTDSLAGALERLSKGPVDAIILDLFLPDSEGLATLRRIHESHPTVPIVVLTNLHDQKIASQAIRQGAQDYLLKGTLLDGERLTRAVRYAVDRMRSKNLLRESEERFELLARATNDAVWDWDLASDRTWWRVGVHSFLGYPPYFVSDDPAWRAGIIHEEDRPRILAGIRSVIDGGGHFWLDEYRHRCADGTFAWVFERGYVMRDAQGRPIRMIGALLDITDRKRAEEALRDTNETLRTLIQASPVGIAVVDTDLNLRIWNPAAEQIFGWKAHEILGRPFPELALAGATDEFRPLVQRAVAGDPLMGVEFQCHRRDGTRITLSVSLAPLRNARGAIAGAMAVVADVSERKSAEKQRFDLEEQLRQSQKMEAVGRLAGGVAHDFNNLLTAISGYAELLRPQFEPAAPEGAYVEEILKSSTMAASLTRQLLAFSRRQVLQPKTLNLSHVVRGMEGLLRRLIGEHITLSISTEEALGAVMADQAQIEQVLMNLAVNARDAMPKGGTLLIETRNEQLDERYTHRHGRVRGGPHAVLIVSDTGLGMDADTQSHLFEPFFTTKEMGKGTGLGLATVYGIIKQSDGDIWVYSEPGVGTTFKIYLPRTAESAAGEAALPAAPAPRKGTETILLVEDSEFVRRLLKELLTRLGHRVLEANNGSEALQVSRGFEGQIQLLLTDVVMPQMGGRELAARILTHRPGIKVMYMSGYTQDAISRHGVLDPGTAFLEKPFTPDGISRKLREVLDGSANP